MEPNIVWLIKGGLFMVTGEQKVYVIYSFFGYLSIFIANGLLCESIVANELGLGMIAWICTFFSVGLLCIIKKNSLFKKIVNLKFVDFDYLFFLLYFLITALIAYEFQISSLKYGQFVSLFYIFFVGRYALKRWDIKVYS